MSDLNDLNKIISSSLIDIKVPDLPEIKGINIEIPELTNLSNQLSEITHQFKFDYADTLAKLQQSIELPDSIKQLSLKIQNMYLEMPVFNTLKNIVNSLPVRYKATVNLRENKCPYFFYLNENNEEYISNIKTSADFTDMLIDECDADFIGNLEENWKNSTFISEERRQLLIETLNLYKNESYAGCVALAATQSNGLTNDLNEKFSNIDEVLDKESWKDEYQYLHRNSSDNEAEKAFINRDKKDKTKLVNFMYNLRFGKIIYGIAIEYLNDVIFTSDPAVSNDENPHRNKICHGEQVNFATQGHAIKSILALDILVRLGYVMDSMNKN